MSMYTIHVCIPWPHTYHLFPQYTEGGRKGEREGEGGRGKAREGEGGWDGGREMEGERWRESGRRGIMQLSFPND